MTNVFTVACAVGKHELCDGTGNADTGDGTFVCDCLCHAEQELNEEAERKAMQAWVDHMAEEGRRTTEYLEWERERNREEYEQARDIQRGERY